MTNEEKDIAIFAAVGLGLYLLLKKKSSTVTPLPSSANLTTVNAGAGTVTTPAATNNPINQIATSISKLLGGSSTPATPSTPAATSTYVNPATGSGAAIQQQYNSAGSDVDNSGIFSTSTGNDNTPVVSPIVAVAPPFDANTWLAENDDIGNLDSEFAAIGCKQLLINDPANAALISGIVKTQLYGRR